MAKLPRGRTDTLMELLRTSVRPIVTLVFAIGATVGFFIGLIPSEQYIILVASVVSYWFNDRTGKKTQ